LKQPRFLLCPPTHFGIEYVINPWMEGQLHAADGTLAARQWCQFQKLLNELADVTLIDPVAGLPDLVFTANAALIYRGSAILSNFRCLERRPESAHFAAWLAADGFQVSTLPDEVFFEGAGDALFERDREFLWAGHGFRSHESVKPFLEQWTGVEVQLLRLQDPRFYHLDTCFCPLEGGHLLYFSAAFDAPSNAAIEARFPSDRRFSVGEEDAISFACNAVNLGNHVILNRAGDSLKDWLGARGFQVTETGVSEFMKAGGATKCLSLRLDE
jgi:N-dimethylarginine dimethylaminohydrolase